MATQPPASQSYLKWLPLFALPIAIFAVVAASSGSGNIRRIVSGCSGLVFTNIDEDVAVDSVALLQMPTAYRQTTIPIISGVVRGAGQGAPDASPDLHHTQPGATYTEGYQTRLGNEGYFDTMLRLHEAMEQVNKLQSETSAPKTLDLATEMDASLRDASFLGSAEEVPRATGLRAEEAFEQRNAEQPLIASEANVETMRVPSHSQDGSVLTDQRNSRTLPKTSDVRAGLKQSVQESANVETANVFPDRTARATSMASTGEAAKASEAEHLRSELAATRQQRDRALQQSEELVAAWSLLTNERDQLLSELGRLAKHT